MITTCLCASISVLNSVEELFLRAALAAEELDVVDQQQIERAVIALEIVERLVLVSAHDVGHVRLGVDVADLRGRVRAAGLVADRLDQVRLAEPDAAVDEQRVVRRRMVGDLHSGRARELVGLAGDERGERERRVEAGRLVRARLASGVGVAAPDSRRAGGGCGWPAAAARTGMPTAHRAAVVAPTVRRRAAAPASATANSTAIAAPVACARASRCGRRNGP